MRRPISPQDGKDCLPPLLASLFNDLSSDPTSIVYARRGVTAKREVGEREETFDTQEEALRSSTSRASVDDDVDSLALQRREQESLESRVLR